MVSKKQLGIIFTILLIFSGVIAGSYLLIFQENKDTPKSTEVIGYWNGMYYDEKIKGFNGNKIHKSKLPKVKNRAMARVEMIRNKPFKEDVSLTIRSREEFKKENPFQFQSKTYANWIDIIWFGQLIIPGQVETAEVREDLRGNQTLAYYSINQDKLVLIVEPNKDGYVKIDEQKLVHELNHAMQDQYIGLNREKLQSKETTVRQAQLSLMEGESQLVEELYADHCKNLNWSCPTYNTKTGHRSYDFPGYDVTVLAPYYTGEKYITNKYEKGGWDAVEKAITKTPPITMADIIYPNQKSPDKRLIQRDISTSKWEPYTVQGYNGQDSLGVVGIISMLHHYEVKYDIDTGVKNSVVFNTLTGTYNYQDDLSEHLKYDAIQPYRTTKGKEGFVWTLVWENSKSADKFTNIYSRVLLEKGGSKITKPEYNLPEKYVSEHNVYKGPVQFQGYFSIARNKEMVVITYSQTKSGLSELRPSRSAPVTVKQYKTEQYKPPQYSIKRQSARTVSSGEINYDKYLTGIFILLLSISYLLYRPK